MRPDSEADLVEAVAGATGPLHVKGGGTRGIGKPVTGTLLETGGLSGITLYEPGALTLVAQSGTPLAEVEAALDAENQRLAFEPMDHRVLLGTVGVPTISGVVATNAAGPRRVQAGACRDFMLGVRFVDGAGRVVSNGGRVMKNVTGYDLVKLMTGSWGTLGVLSEVSLKILPRPETAACVMIEGLDDRAAVAAMATALGSPFEVSGAAHLPAGPDGTAVTMLRLEGFSRSVGYRAEQLKALFSAQATRVEEDPGRVSGAWDAVRDVRMLAGQAGDVWRVSCKPSDAPGLVEKLLPIAHLYDWGGGLVWALLAEGTDARVRLGAFGGHATLVRGSEASRRALPVFQPEPAPVAALAEGIRARLDPRGILNPGLLGA